MRNWFIDGVWIWQKGTCEIHGLLSGRVHTVNARKNRIKGNVQFVLWKAGERGHKKDYWHDLHPTHWSFFKATEKTA